LILLFLTGAAEGRAPQEDGRLGRATGKSELDGMVGLKEYRRKRHFGLTPEPSGMKKSARSARGLFYVFHKHRASQLHYDLHLEWKGVLLSWAVPKGPSVDPSVRRMATQTEERPLDYWKFEGIIPEKDYGGVQCWSGTRVPGHPKARTSMRRSGRGISSSR
jgi:DNA ligase D-like protein (predicted 3'-phosphoesterase)